MAVIFITEPIAAGAMEQMRCRGWELLKGYEGDDPAGCDAILVRSIPIDRAYMQRCPRLRLVACHGVGVDNVDLEAARERGVMVTNTPGANAGAVAELTMAFLLALSRQLLPVTRAYADRGFQSKYDFSFGELSGKTLGLIGMGSIGSRVARMARDGFGMRVLACTASGESRVPGIEATRDLLRVCREADFVSLHCPYAPSTHHLLSDEAFGVMKTGAMLVNTARGAVVDEAALLRALEKGKLAGAALDVTDPEPAAPDSPLFTHEKVILTPHVGASTREALDRMAQMCIESIEAVLAGREPDHRVV